MNKLKATISFNDHVLDFSIDEIYDHDNLIEGLSILYQEFRAEELILEAKSLGIMPIHDDKWPELDGDDKLKSLEFFNPNNKNPNFKDWKLSIDTFSDEMIDSLIVELKLKEG